MTPTQTTRTQTTRTPVRRLQSTHPRLLLGGLLGAALLAPMISLPTLVAAPLDPRQDSGQGMSPQRGDDATRGREQAREVDQSRWLDRLPREDRAALDIIVGYGAPELADDLTWHGAERTTLEALRGKVVVIQSFTTRATRTLPQRLEANLGARRERGLQLLALHTPENADRAEPMLERLEIGIPVLIDASGVTSDRFGIFRRPVNVVIDRVGNVRFAGLNERGLEQAVDLLLAEPHDAEAKPRVREVAEAVEVQWPTFTSPVGRARDLRGQQSPTFHVANWIKDEDQPRGRLTIIDFWATWCGPCRAMIPHMNEIAQHYGDRVFIVGLSDEGNAAFDRGMIQRNLRLSGFQYSLGLDHERRMMGAFQVQSIPHVAVISGDGIVRWQGHPNGLTRDVLDQLVTANELLRGSGGSQESPTAPPARWQQQNARGRS